MHGSQHAEKTSIDFGKQLIDTFKPSSILVEDGPMQVPKTEEYACQDSGLVYPATYELTHEIGGSIADQFIRQNIEGNKEVYKIDDKQDIVLKLYNDGYEEPFDMGTIYDGMEWDLIRMLMMEQTEQLMEVMQGYVKDACDSVSSTLRADYDYYFSEERYNEEY